MAKPATPTPAQKPAPVAAPAPVASGPADITALELAEITRKLDDHDGDRNALSASELKGLHQHERFVRHKQHVTETIAAAVAATDLPKRNAEAFKTKLAGLVSARDKAGLAALVRDLENCQRLRDSRAEAGESFIKVEIKRHEGRIAKLRAALKRSTVDTQAISERVAAAKAALAGIDDVTKCQHCGQRFSTKRNLDQHVLTCKAKPVPAPAKPAAVKK